MEQQTVSHLVCTKKSLHIILQFIVTVQYTAKTFSKVVTHKTNDKWNIK